ncbi:hypothetical protein PENSPDRAFT_759580 [Peniophora sp. CONT]|nr:hypothetical protein PENSPDRAFT_759580 [Peniophora sp. CONT]
MASGPLKAKAKARKPALLAPASATRRARKASRFSKLPPEMIHAILEALDELDDEPPKGLCRFMRVCKHFHEIASSAHTLWARSVLGPAITRTWQLQGDPNIESAIAARISTIVDRSKHALFTLRTPRTPAGHQVYWPSLWTHLPPLLPKARDTTLNLSHMFATVNFLRLLNDSDTHNLECLSISTPALRGEDVQRYLHAFPYIDGGRGGTPTDICIPSLRRLALNNVLPCCYNSHGLTSLSIGLRGVPKEVLPSPAWLFQQLRPLRNLTHLGLHDCISDPLEFSNINPLELSNLAHLELTSPPSQCAQLLEHLQLLCTVSILWEDSSHLLGEHQDYPAAVGNLLEVLLRVLDITGRKRHGAHVEVMNHDAYPHADHEQWLTGSKVENYCGDGRSKVFTPNIDISLYDHAATENLPDGSASFTANGPIENPIVLLRFRADRRDFPYGRIHDLIHSSLIDSLALSVNGFGASGYVQDHAKNILRSFPAITSLRILSLMTPATLAAVVTASMDLSVTPLLRALFVREFGHPYRTKWASNLAVTALCEGLSRARQRAGSEPSVAFRAGTVFNIHEAIGLNCYKRGDVIGSGKRLDGLWDLLAEAQNST